VTVKVLYFAVLRDLFGRAGESVALAPGATLATLAETLSERVPGLRAHLGSLAWGLNLELVPLQTMLKEGDEVALLPPVSGGRP
jgi:molybdopterin converting factor small subunit